MIKSQSHKKDSISTLKQLPDINFSKNKRWNLRPLQINKICQSHISNTTSNALFMGSCKLSLSPICNNKLARFAVLGASDYGPHGTYTIHYRNPTLTVSCVFMFVPHHSANRLQWDLYVCLSDCRLDLGYDWCVFYSWLLVASCHCQLLLIVQYGETLWMHYYLHFITKLQSK